MSDREVWVEIREERAGCGDAIGTIIGSFVWLLILGGVIWVGLMLLVKCSGN